MQYEDDEGDRVLMDTDNDLIGAVNHARLAGWKVIFSSAFLSKLRLREVLKYQMTLRHNPEEVGLSPKWLNL